MKTLTGLVALGAMLTGCVVVVDGTSDGDAKRMSFWGNEGSVTAVEPIDAQLEAFDGIAASAGSNVTIVQGSQYAISLDGRAAATAEWGVDDGVLEIGCFSNCNNGVRGEITVTVPTLTRVSASSGADVVIADGFAPVDTLSLSASSGADLDAHALTADIIEARASSGASVRAAAEDRLTGRASSGASIRYWGSPDEVEVSRSSGGSVRAASQ